MWHQLQIPIYLAKLGAGPVADTAVACLAILCFLTLKHSWHGMEYKRSIAATAASFANVALLLSTTDSISARSIASVAAALALFVCSAASLSQGNLQACLHVIRMLNTAFNPSLLPLHVAAASSLIHLLAAWKLLNAGTKAHIVRCLYDMLGIRGLSLVMLGKRRPLTIEDIRDPATEEEFFQKCKQISNDCSEKTTVTALLLIEWRRTVYIMAIDTIIQLTSRSRQLVFIAILSAASRGDHMPNTLELGTLFVVWQLLALISPAWRHFSTLQTDFKKRKRALITGKIQAIYAFSRRETVGLWRIQHSADELVDISESFMSIISAALAEILNAWVTASRIGWRALVPIIVASIHLFISRLVTKKIQRLRDENRVNTAPKFQHDFTSMLHNIRTVKFYAWEDVFSKGQSSARPKEYEPPMVWRVLELILNLISHTTAEVSAVLAITSFIGAAGTISYVDVMLLIGSIQSLTSFTVTIARLSTRLSLFQVHKEILQQFLDGDSSKYIERVLTVGDSVADLEECVFSWGANTYSLSPITLQIKEGDFVTVVGRIGSGKSSFLSALCGEMPLMGGQGCVRGRIGYVEQKPWVMNATFRDNILMGADFDEAYFWQVVDACALAADVRLFPNSDLTMIGTNGVNLSGGQKMRLALARALYMRADIYVFDDLLSAVDSHVERHIVEHVLATDGIIGYRTRILVTHAEHLVPLSDMVITFVDGNISVARQIPLALSTVSIEVHGSRDKMAGRDSDAIDQTPAAADIYTKSPEVRRIGSSWSAIRRFIRLSGVYTLAIVIAIHIAQNYALYYTHSLRTKLMTDNNPATMAQSLQSYLIVNALVTIASHQIYNLERWIQRTILTTRLKAKLHKQVVNLALSMPLPILESLPYSTMNDLYLQSVYTISDSIPAYVCSFIVGNNLSAVSAIAQVIKTSPSLLIVCAPLVVLNHAIRGWYEGILPKLGGVRRESIGRPRERLNDALERNRPLLRVHGMTGTCLDKLSQLKSMELSFELSSKAIRESRDLMTKTLFSEIIKTGLLGFKLYRRLFASIPVSPGELVAEISLATSLFFRANSIISQRGLNDSCIDHLSQYISYMEDTPRELPRIVSDCRPQPSWPETGDIEFRQYRLRYRPDLDPALNDLSFVVRSKEKIGIVGRTGAGKSSLTYALMRLVEADSGSIVIDGIDISTIGLHDLRSRISIIPQDPSLFVGTIRDNLDPAHQYTDDEVWAAINACQIADLLDAPAKICNVGIKNAGKADKASNPQKPHWTEGAGLDKWVESKGSNFSVGQQQLVSLCRALLWRRKILVLDEATANVDTKTDRIMQSVIRQEFKDCTVLTIAHRLNTIMDSDRVLVMDQGRVAEFDTPGNLLARDGGHFKRLVESMNLSKKQ